MSTIQIQKVEVVGSPSKLPLKIATPYKKLPGDASLEGSQAQQHTRGRVVFDEIEGVNVDQERTLVCHWKAEDKDFLNITLNDFPHEFSHKLCEVSLCVYDSDDPWGIGATVFTTQHQTSNESIQSFGLRPNWVRRGRVALQQPFGLWNEFVAVVWQDSKVFVVTPPIRLELYWLPAEAQLSPVLSVGVPLQLLRMFVLPSTKNHTNSKAEWIKSTVGICHGSNKPYTAAISTTLRHWLKYDTLTGSGSFTATYGPAFFDAVKWVDAYRHWKLAKYVTKVNCYDQAAILQIVLSFGIPFRQIHWEYHQVYGFLGNDSKLVGWGECNNPYFNPREGRGFDRTRQLVANGDSNRRPFRNHVYLTLTDYPFGTGDYNIYNNEMKTVQSHSAWKAKVGDIEGSRVLPKKYVVDACAGPCLGDELESSDDDNSLIIEDLLAAQQSRYTYVREDSNRNPKRWKQVHWSGPGILVGDKDQPEHPAYLPSHTAILKQRDLLVGTQDIQSARVLGGRVDFIENAFENWILSQVSKLGWQDVIDIPVRPVRLDDGSFILETRISYKKQDDDLDSVCQNQIALRVLTCPNADVAADLLARRLATLVHTSLLEPTIVGIVTSSGIPIVGNEALRALTYRNIAIDISGDDRDIFGEGEDKDSDLLAQKLAGILVEMRLTPGNCWQDLM